MALSTDDEGEADWDPSRLQNAPTSFFAAVIAATILGFRQGSTTAPATAGS